MKKALSVLLALVLCLILCACGDDAGTTPTDKIEPTGNETPNTPTANQPTESVGLEYAANDDGTYTVVGIGTCTDLDVVIPANYNGAEITGIGDAAFEGCNNITSINIPGSVTSIGSNAFAGCSCLTSITIPASVTIIGDYAFQSCSSMTSINVCEGNKIYHSQGNCLIETETKVLLAGCSNSVIPDDGSVTSIGEGAFIRCTGLTNINIPANIASIGESAFAWCGSLTNVTIDDGVTSIGEGAFYWCSALISVDIPNSVTSIGEEAFTQCENLTSVTIGNGVTSIGEDAFARCYNLASIYIPASVTSIGDTAFESCVSVTSINVDESNKVYHSQGNCLIKTATKVLLLGCSNSVIPDDGSVASVGEHAFYNCRELTSIEIPNSVTTIGEAAFCECASLISVTIPDSVTSIGMAAFSRCSNLSSITIGNGVASIGRSAFYNCSSLTDIYYSGTVEQWDALSKAEGWNTDTGTYTIHCTDGDISK